jgi:hypothetical protein
MPMHIKYLTAPKTLQLMAGQTLDTRAKMFHRQFPDKRISAGALSLLYKRNGIRKTKVYAAKT